MSLPSNGSTAPAITSPLLAWPSKPLARNSPLSSGSDDTFGGLAASTSYSSLYSRKESNDNSIVRPPSLKGKEWATTPEVRVVGTDPFDAQTKGEGQEYEYESMERRPERHYAPPKKPLPPHQLGRIAQSFGIVIPNLPQQQVPTPTSPTSRPLSPGAISTSSSRGRLSPLLSASSPTRPSPFLLSVIPPLILLSPSLGPEQIVQRAKKWRRGRLLPLQPTLRSMLVSIAREYGLPSTVGIGVYLVIPGVSKGDGSSSAASSTWSLSDNDEPNGPLISPSTWSTLFAVQLTGSGGTATRSSTPSTTPVKGAGTLARDIAYPPSPLSMTNKHPPGRKAKMRSLSSGPTPTKPSVYHSSHPSTSTASSNLPPTPASLGPPPSAPTSPNPIIGTIEFDIDLEEATWFEDWRKAGGASRHKRSLTGEGGIKELNLVRKVQDGRPRFLKELDVNRPTPERKRASIHGTGHISNSASFYGFEGEGEEAEGREVGNITVSSDSALLSAHAHEADDLLASPVDFDRLHVGSASPSVEHAALQKIKEALDKRGSGLVMSDQLDDLEKIMRQLSPREIRLTSPRMLTPRMAAKVSNMPIELPAVPRQSAVKPISSPLASTFPVPNDSDSNGQVDFGAPAQDLDADVGFAPPRPAWPAIPHGSPDSPSTAQDYFARQQDHPRVPSQRNVSSPAALTLSAETQKRMQETSGPAKAAGTTGTEWVPRRPARPPSPRLPHQRTLSHTLSPELVNHLRSPPSGSGRDRGRDLETSPDAPAPGSGEEKKHKSRQSSISLKGLRHQMSGKNLNVVWREKEAPPQPQPVGLFKSGVGEGHQSSFPGLQALGQRSVSGPAQILSQTQTQGPAHVQSEFGALSRSDDVDTTVPPNTGMANATASATGSLPAKPSSSGRFTSRIFHSPFAFGRKNDDPAKSSKRHPHPSEGSVQISAPITSTLRHESGSGPGTGADLQPPTSPASPALPSSPRSVRRKPVPLAVAGTGTGTDAGMAQSESMASMASFVLEDPPRGKRTGAATGLGMGMAV